MSEEIKIPQEILDAALDMSRYFKARNVGDWQLANVADRAFVRRLERELAEAVKAGDELRTENGRLTDALRRSEDARRSLSDAVDFLQKKESNE